MKFFKQRPKAESDASLYYASDLYGSDQIWRKFLGAARHYHVDALVMGGDLTGKAIVPIEKKNGGYEAFFLGETRSASEGDLEELLAAVRYNGMYPWVASGDEIARLQSDEAARDELFDRVMLDELRRWIELADERMSALGVDVHVMAGNDDPWSVDDVLRGTRHVQFCDDRIVRIGSHEMISCSFANPTPWDSPRELEEDALYAKIKSLAEQVEDPANAIFNLHVPPYDSGLDIAAEIDENLTVVYQAGQPKQIPVGSKAVRQILEEFQPLISLHGHIHESRAEATIGRTLAINTGSEYTSGQIHGAVIRLARGQVLSHQFVIG